MKVPELRTERLRLRQAGCADAGRVAELAGDKEVARRTATVPHPLTHEQAKEKLERAQNDAAQGKAAVFAIERSEEVLGLIGLHFEWEHERASFGYWLGRPFWGEGYTTEAAKRVMEWGFLELGLWRIAAEALEGNWASMRVAEKLGMRKEGVRRKAFKRFDQFHDIHVFARLRSDPLLAS